MAGYEALNTGLVTIPCRIQQETSPDLMESRRAAQLRQNKRNYRTRQREYVQELEQRLEAVRREGVKATKEVQLSAQQVVQENRRLRQLLRHAGVDDGTVEAWLSDSSETAGENGATGRRPKCDHSPCGQPKLDHPHSEKDNLNTKKVSPPASTACEPQPLSKESGSQNITPADSITSQACKTPSSDSAPTADEHEPPIQPITPCKLLTRFAADGNADIAGECDGADEGLITDKTGGVECSRAYRMLRGFATTEEKLDAIAHTLERAARRQMVGVESGTRIFGRRSIW